MKNSFNSPDEYLDNLPDDRKAAVKELRKVISDSLPEGFAEIIAYGMISYVVPHSLYPAGYHCDPKQPLPFISIASQKQHIVLHHMGLYADKELMEWFTAEYAKVVKSKPDMGKGCVRFKKAGEIPYKLVGKLVSRIQPEKWIKIYESNFKKK